MLCVGLLSGLYFTSVFCFSFVSHPVYYCLLLLSCSASVCGIIYSLVGFSWYLVLFCLVYVGGVYILFIFVSVYSPKTFLGSELKFGSAALFFLLVFMLFSSGSFMVDDVVTEYSHYLCSSFEGTSYILFCLVLVLGFMCVSIVVNRKDSFYR